MGAVAIFHQQGIILIRCLSARPHSNKKAGPEGPASDRHTKPEKTQPTMAATPARSSRSSFRVMSSMERA